MPGSPVPRVSLRDVARAAGVSHVAVSLALRGSPRVSAARRAELRALAARLGYRPDPMLSSLSAYRQRKRGVTIRSTVAWINRWPDPAALRRHREFDAFWHGALEAAAQLGYRLEEFVVPPALTGERLHRIFAARSVRGLLIPPHPEPFALGGFAWDEFAVVRFGYSVSTLPAHVVAGDQTGCARLAVEQIAARGYRRIGFVSSPRFDRNTRGNFRAGYLAARSDAAPLAPLLLSEPTTAADARRLAAWLGRERPDAVISTHAGLRALLERLGVRVPDDLAVAASSIVDGNFDAGIDQNAHEIGRVATRTLAGLIHQGEHGLPQVTRRVLVEGRWVDGTSLPARAAGRLRRA